MSSVSFVPLVAASVVALDEVQVVDVFPIFRRPKASLRFLRVRGESLDHGGELALGGGLSIVQPRLERGGDLVDLRAREMTALSDVRVASSQRVAVEAVLRHELARDTEHALGGDAPVLVDYERGLQVVVERHHARTVDVELVRRRLLVEMNEHAFDGVFVLDGPSQIEDFFATSS